MVFNTKLKAVLLLIMLVSFSAYSQQFSGVNFNNLPQNWELYPRNEKNEAFVEISGVVADSTINKISVLTFKNGLLINYNSQPIAVKNKKGPFNFSQKIFSELSEYDFKIYSHKSKSDSSLVVHRKNIVSGDVFVVTGESNSYFGYNSPDVYKGEYARSFGVFTDKNNTANYNPADTLWCVSNTNKNAVGFWASELQKLIIEKQKIPVCIINGGSGGSSSQENANRNKSNPADLTNMYGRLLYKLQKAKVLNSVKGFFYRQGEYEAINEPSTWQKGFDKVYENIRLDFPKSLKIYVFQNDIYDTENKLSGVTREQQRQIKYRYPGEKNINVIATVGTVGFTGLNYTNEGYKQTAEELYLKIGHDFYGSQAKNYSTPNIEKILYDNVTSEVILIFDENQEMQYPDPFEINGSTIFIEEFLQLAVRSFLEIKGRAEGNRIILKIGEGFAGKKMTYMFPFFIKGTKYIPFTKPLFTNKNGLRALTFEDFPIVDALGTPKMIAKKIATTIEWQCNRVKDATNYKVEIKVNNEEKFTEMPAIKINDSGIYKMNLSNYFKDFTSTKNFQFRFRATGEDLLESSYAPIIKVNYEVGSPQLTDIKTIGLEKVELNWESDYQDPNYKYVVGVSFYNRKNFYEIEPVGYPAKSAIIKNLFQGNRYFFRIRAFNDTLGLYSSYSINGIGSTWIVQPSDLIAKDITTSSAKLEWKYDIEANAESSLIKTLVLEHSQDGKNFKILKELPDTEIGVVVDSLKEASKQFYRIFVRREDDIISNWSNLVKVVALPLKPTNLVATSKTINTIDLNWQDNSNGETGYQVWAAKKDDIQYKKLITLPANTIKFSAKQLFPGTEYSFKILAEVNDVVSEFSDEAIASTQVITGLEQPIVAENIVIQPNPVLNDLTFIATKSIAEPSIISVFDNTGRLVFEKNFDSILQKTEYQLPIKDLNLGLYYFELRSKKRRITKKFLKN
jgi:hypothetical protein